MLLNQGCLTSVAALSPWPAFLACVHLCCSHQTLPAPVTTGMHDGYPATTKARDQETVYSTLYMCIIYMYSVFVLTAYDASSTAVSGGVYTSSVRIPSLIYTHKHSNIVIYASVLVLYYNVNTVHCQHSSPTMLCVI